MPGSNRSLRAQGKIERVWLVRHGQVEENLRDPGESVTGAEYDRMIVASEDSPLTPVGRRQIEGLVAVFQDRPLPAIHSSPLSRARESAEILARTMGLEVVVVEGFRELVPVPTGVRHGRPRPIQRWFLRSMVRQFLLPWLRRGESVWRARRRVRRAWAELLAWSPDGGRDDGAGERLVVAHQGTVLLLTSVLRRDPAWRVARRSTENAGITEIVRTDGSGEGMETGKAIASD
jgi:broad specificity phosphatase PhoE